MELSHYELKFPNYFNQTLQCYKRSEIEYLSVSENTNPLYLNKLCNFYMLLKYGLSYKQI